MPVVDVNPPTSGASLVSVWSGPDPLPVYSDAGRTQSVSLPLTIPQTGTTTVYLPPAPRWEALVASGTGGTVWRGGGTAAAGDVLTFRSVVDVKNELADGVDGGSA